MAETVATLKRENARLRQQVETLTADLDTTRQALDLWRTNAKAERISECEMVAQVGHAMRAHVAMLTTENARLDGIIGEMLAARWVEMQDAA